MKAQGLQSPEADEGTHLLPDAARPPSPPAAPPSRDDDDRRRRDNARDILLSSTLSRLGSRSWEFATPLLVLEWSPGSLAAPAAFGLANAAVCTAAGPWLGRRADGWDRLCAVLLGAAMQATGCLVSIGALALWNRARASGYDDGGAGTDRGRLVSLSIVVLAGVLEALGAGLAKTAVKKEWVPICFEGGDAGRRDDGAAADADGAGPANSSPRGRLLPRRPTMGFMNTSMINIDLCAAMFGPVLAGWVLQLLAGGGGAGAPSAQRGFVAIAGLNVASFVPEALLLRRVYGSCAALRRREGRRGGEGAGPEGGGGDRSAWRLWLSHPSGLQLLSVSLASLYLTVLSPSSGILTAYLVTIGLAPSSIGAFRAVGALSGVAGIGLFSVARQWGDGGREPARKEDIAGHATARSIEKLRRVSSGFLLLEVVAVIAAGIAFSRCDTPGMIERHRLDGSIMSSVPAPLYAFLGLICVSRAGLYSFDIGALEIEQHIVDERYRNTIGSVENSLCSLVWMMVFVMSIAIPDPARFGIQVGVSAVAVTVGWLCFMVFLCLYLNHGHFHHEAEEADEHAEHHGHSHTHSHIHEHTLQQEKDLQSCNGFHIHLHKHNPGYCCGTNLAACKYGS